LKAIGKSQRLSLDGWGFVGGANRLRPRRGRPKVRRTLLCPPFPQLQWQFLRKAAMGDRT